MELSILETLMEAALKVKSKRLMLEARTVWPYSSPFQGQASAPRLQGKNKQSNANVFPMTPFPVSLYHSHRLHPGLRSFFSYLYCTTQQHLRCSRAAFRVCLVSPASLEVAYIQEHYPVPFAPITLCTFQTHEWNSQHCQPWVRKKYRTKCVH